MRRIGALGTALVMVWAGTAVAAEKEKADYGRTGVYIGAGASMAFNQFEDELQSELQSEATSRANASGQISTGALAGRGWTFEGIPLTPVSGVNPSWQWGGNGRVGYRMHPLVAFELEGEWIGDYTENFIVVESGDIGTSSVTDIWTITANTRFYPLTGRIQPFALVGAGIIHAEVTQRITTDGLEGTAMRTVMMVDEFAAVDTDFTIDRYDSKITGAVRLGGGIDIYLTENIAAELKADYVFPFDEVVNINTDYISFSWGLLYRF